MTARVIAVSATLRVRREVGDEQEKAASGTGTTAWNNGAGIGHLSVFLYRKCTLRFVRITNVCALVPKFTSNRELEASAAWKIR